MVIQKVITYHCPKCNSLNLEKNGTYNGSQKYHCLDCNDYGALDPQPKAYPVTDRPTLCQAQSADSSQARRPMVTSRSRPVVTSHSRPMVTSHSRPMLPAGIAPK